MMQRPSFREDKSPMPFLFRLPPPLTMDFAFFCHNWCMSSPLCLLPSSMTISVSSTTTTAETSAFLPSNTDDAFAFYFFRLTIASAPFSIVVSLHIPLHPLYLLLVTFLALSPVTFCLATLPIQPCCQPLSLPYFFLHHLYLSLGTSSASLPTIEWRSTVEIVVICTCMKGNLTILAPVYCML